MSDFDVLYAPLVASWVRSDQELTWLAPGTVPPLSASKVINWGRHVGYRFLFWSFHSPSARNQPAGPIGYAELNMMPTRSDQMWIGHFVLDPGFRGRGYGQQFVRALLQYAFELLTVNDVLLVVFPENTPAIRCYEKSGMVITGSERKYFKNTRREHRFYRMEMTCHQFEMMTASHGPRIPFVDDTGRLRAGVIARRRAINQS